MNVPLPLIIKQKLSRHSHTILDSKISWNDCLIKGMPVKLSGLPACNRAEFPDDAPKSKLHIGDFLNLLFLQALFDVAGSFPILETDS